MKKLVIPLAALVFIVAIVLLRPARTFNERSAARRTVEGASDETIPIPSRDPVPPSEAGRGFHDSTLIGMIQNAKVAELKGDRVTRDAMIAGLKKEPADARRLLSRKF